MPASGNAGTGVIAGPPDSSDQLLLPLAGPWTWVARPVVNVRPSSVHTAPVSPQGGDGDSFTVYRSAFRSSSCRARTVYHPAVTRLFLVDWS